MYVDVVHDILQTLTECTPERRVVLCIHFSGLMRMFFGWTTTSTSHVLWWAETRRFPRCRPLAAGKDWRVCESETRAKQGGYERMSSTLSCHGMETGQR